MLDADDQAVLDTTDLYRFTPEGKLFIALFSGAMHDALNNKCTSREKYNAISFLTREPQDLRDICLSVAGYHKDYVKRKLIEVLGVKEFFTLKGKIK
jgi:hypothetical protein